MNLKRTILSKIMHIEKAKAKSVNHGTVNLENNVSTSYAQSPLPFTRDDCRCGKQKQNI